MRVAVCLSGHFRYFEKTFPNFEKYVLNILNPDVFIHTWDNTGVQIRNSNYKIDDKELLLVDRVKKLYHPAVMVVEKFEDVKKHLNSNKYKQTVKVPVENILSMYRKVMLADNLRASHGHYDLVIKCRPDLLFKSEIPESELNDIDNIIYVPDTGNKQINDHMAFGDSGSMEYYSSLYDKVDLYYDEDAPDAPETSKHGCAIHAETLLNFHLSKSSYKIKETNTNYLLPHKHQNIIDSFQSL